MSDKKPSAGKVKQLEEEGDVAADYLEEFLDIADFDGDIEIDVENGRAAVAIVSDDPNSDLDRLVGEDGEVLEALQELTRLAVQAATGERSRLMLDVAGFRAARRSELQALTQDAVDRVKETGEPVALEPMNPFERKVCHDVVSVSGLHSESEGAEPGRHLVIYLSDGDDAEVIDEGELEEDGE